MTLRLTQICIYPIKSLGGISLSAAAVKPKGLEYDRRWMLIDSKGVAMTQRSYHDMALLKVSFRNGHLWIDRMSNGGVRSSISFDPRQVFDGENISAHVWNDTVHVLEVSRELSEWFSEQLSIRCRLVAFPEPNPRLIDEAYKVKGEHLSLADAYPFLLIGQASLDDLNSKMRDPVPMNRFRPNFVFDGGVPYEEDNWRDFSIGNIRFVAVKKCDRCVLTTINQETAERGVEPLRTLSSFRKIGSSVFFGQNLVARDVGVVSVGDAIIRN